MKKIATMFLILALIGKTAMAEEQHPKVGMNYKEVEAVWGHWLSYDRFVTKDHMFETVCYDHTNPKYATFRDGVLEAYSEGKR